MEAIREFRIAENMGGHDGIANGGHYGGYTVLFGIFPDGAVTVGDEKPNAVHSRQTGHRLNNHQDTWEKGYSIDESRLRPGDFVAREARYKGQIYNSRGGEVEIIAHRLPIGVDIPKEWETVGGKKSSHANGYGESTYWSFIRSIDGSHFSFEEAAKELGLVEMVHPYGKLWMDGDMPVAITDSPKWSAGADNFGFSNDVILGNHKFFADKGLAVLQLNDKKTYYDPGMYYSCSQIVVCRELNIANLRTDGWYPIEVRDGYVIWATGLHLYPKDLHWQIGSDPAYGSPEDKRGVRLFDSSRNRMDKVREFFREAVGVAVSDPEAEYLRWANGSDPRAGKWRNSHHYPPAWTPYFAGCSIARLGKVECRWKQPKIGTARFYGVVH